jgi:UDPglucose 6-dehydrogenase
MANASRQVPDLRLAEDPYELAGGADALLVCTEWNEFKQLDLGRLKGLMTQPVLVDGRNIYNPTIMKNFGFRYKAVGRGSVDENGN